jgi:hypothetical protein
MLVAGVLWFLVALLTHAPSTHAAEALRIPVLVPLTGFLALEGTSQRNGAVLALTAPPANLTIQYEVQDTATAPESAVNALAKALGPAPPFAVVASMLGTQILAMLPLAAERRIEAKPSFSPPTPISARLIPRLVRERRCHPTLGGRIERDAPEGIGLVEQHAPLRRRADELERRIGELEQVSHAAADPPVGFVAARVIATSSGAFARSAVVNAGREHGLKVGYPVITAEGVVGRVVELGRRASSVLLLSDLNSRIPVVVGKLRVRALMIGDNGPLPRLVYVGNPADIESGDEVSTSGVGGLFPRGLRVGNVVGGAKEPRVQPAAQLDQLEYLKVLQHESATLQLTDDTPPARASDAAQVRGVGPRSPREVQR